MQVLRESALRAAHLVRLDDSEKNGRRGCVRLQAWQTDVPLQRSGNGRRCAVRRYAARVIKVSLLNQQGARESTRGRKGEVHAGVDCNANAGDV